jgi:hypothetical protein
MLGSRDRSILDVRYKVYDLRNKREFVGASTLILRVSLHRVHNVLKPLFADLDYSCTLDTSYESSRGRAYVPS